ncbi:MAG: T9SS type A sorting domain-containing protein, partial [candidate division WOR-3 bacterium]|nr:T9SS type A sorting domain-containing protein [candidate division WOR-3 bacterium]
FTPSGINLSRTDNDNMYSIHFDRLITGNMMNITVTGINTQMDISIYDIQGRRVNHIFTGSVNGSKSMNIKTDMPPGIYFIKDNKNPEIYDSKFIILR